MFQQILNVLSFIVKEDMNVKYVTKLFMKIIHLFQKNNKISNYTKLAVLELLKDHTQTFTAIAKRFNVSVPTVINIFDEEIKIDRLKLPEAICIDEFYTSKSRQYKYACVFLDFASKKIIDVFPSRHSNKLGKELSFIPKMERLVVKFTIIDVYKPYEDLSKRFFRNTKIAVDSFHVIKHLNDVITKIRIKIMNKYNNKSAGNLLANDKYYYMLKKFGYFSTKEFDNIYNGLIQI